MKTAVVYTSKYGFTRQYAAWIAEALSCDLLDARGLRPAALEPYDALLFGGGLYAGGVGGISLLTKNFQRLKGKRLALFTCGLADPSDPENVSHIRAGLDKILTPPMGEAVEIFHLRGGIDYARLGPVHRAMMAMLRRMLLGKDPDTLRQEDRELLRTYGQKVDFTDKASIAPILEYMRQAQP